MEGYELLTEYIRPELMVLVVVLYCIGKALKKVSFFNDELIPVALGVIGVILSAIYVLSVESISGGYQEFLAVVFDICIQGICCGAAAVYFNQIYKQNNKLKEIEKAEKESK